jgi:hypothetical protein
MADDQFDVESITSDNEEIQENQQVEESKPARTENVWESGHQEGAKFLRLNPASLIEKFPADPSIEEARDEWHLWKLTIDRVIKEDETKLQLLYTKGGPFLKRILLAHDEVKFDEAVKIIEEHLAARSNLASDIAAFAQLKQEKKETFEAYAKRVQRRAVIIGEKDELKVQIQIIQGAINKWELKKMSEATEMKLNQLIRYGIQAELAAAEENEEKSKAKKESSEILPPEAEVISAIRENRPTSSGWSYKARGYDEGRVKNLKPYDSVDCKYCGGRHEFRQCPAYGKRCNICNKMNHFGRVCKTNSQHLEER